MTKNCHRVAYELAHGEIPSGMIICHTCDNPACCNPAHLWAGTNADNVHDRERKHRGKHALGENHGRTSLTDQDVTNIIHRYRNGEITQRALAHQYGVNKNTIWNIINGKFWKHITSLA